MELLDLPALADRTNLSLDTAQRYHELFFFFVPAVRQGSTLMFPPAAVDVLETIHLHMERGDEPQTVAEALEERYPITVLSTVAAAGDSPAAERAKELVELAASGLTPAARQRRTELALMLSELTSLRSELAELRTQRSEPPTPSASDELLRRATSALLGSMTQLQEQVGALRGALERREDELTRMLAPAESAAASRPAVEEHTANPTAEVSTEGRPRTRELALAAPPSSLNGHVAHRRRLGQPLKPRETA